MPKHHLAAPSFPKNKKKGKNKKIFSIPKKGFPAALRCAPCGASPAKGETRRQAKFGGSLPKAPGWLPTPPRRAKALLAQTSPADASSRLAAPFNGRVALN